MHVYFVRHGETILNRRFIHQSPTTPLSPKGRDQALSAAEYLRAMNPDLLLTSKYTRAQETARIIGSVLDLKPQATPLFNEVERPTILCGRSLFHPETFKYVLYSTIHRNDPRWHYCDGENYMDVYNRVRDALIHLKSLSKTHKSVVVVSHTIVINLLVAYMCHGRLLSMRDLIPTFLHMEKTDNGEVVAIKYLGKTAPNTCPWELVHYAA